MLANSFAGDAWAQSAEIRDLTICAQDPLKQWTHEVADGFPNGPCSEPSAFAPHPGANGAQTIPFAEPEATVQRVRLGEICPL